MDITKRGEKMILNTQKDGMTLNQLTVFCKADPSFKGFKRVLEHQIQW